MVIEDTIPFVDTWECEEEEDMFIVPSNKIMVVKFSKVIKGAEDGKFMIGKNAYNKRLVEYYPKSEMVKPVELRIPDKSICHYLNYFLKYFDPEHELLMSYFYINYMNKKKSVKLSLEETIKMMNSALFTDSIIKKIQAMVEYNYSIDVESGDEVYDSAFTNEHAKVLIAISIAMRFLIAPMSQYAQISNYSKEDYINYKFFLPLFDMFSTGADVYNKLWQNINKAIEKSVRPNQTTWDQYEANGEEPQYFIDSILRQIIITDTMFKYSFRKNIIAFNYVVVTSQIRNIRKERFDFLPRTFDTKKDDTGLSEIDKLEMNNAKVDESLIVLSLLNIQQALYTFAHDVKKAEVDYYMENLVLDKFQNEMVNYFYSQYMGFGDLKFLNKRQRMTLTVALKHNLRKMNFIYLPIMLSSNMVSRNDRMVNNQKFTSKVENSDIYQNMMKEKFSIISKDPDRSKAIIKIISTFIKSKFTIVDYDNPDALGIDIESVDDIVSAEVIRYISIIN